MTDKFESGFESGNPKEKINHFFEILNKEIANIYEIIDGGWNTFGAGNLESRNDIYHNLIEIRDMAEEFFDVKPEPQRADYENIKNTSKYLKNLKASLEAIKLTIDSLDINPRIKDVFREDIKKAIDAHNNLGGSAVE